MCFVRWSLVLSVIFSISYDSVAICSSGPAHLKGYEALRYLDEGIDALPSAVADTQDCSYLPRIFHTLEPPQVEILNLIGCYESRIQVNVTEDSLEFRHLATNVVQLTLTDGELTDIPSLFAYDSLQFQAVHFLIAFPSLRLVKFSHNKIQKIELDTFSYNPQLREIYLDSNEIEAIQTGAFKKLIHLEILDLSRNKLLETPPNLPLSLISLDLSANLLERVAPQTIEENVNRLETLNLCGNNFKPKTSLVQLDFGNVRSLCLGSAGLGFPIQKNEMWDFQMINLTLMSEKNLHWTLNQTSLNAIKKLLRLRELNIGFFKVESLEFLHPLSKLEVLRMNNITLDPIHSLPPMFFNNKRDLRVVDFDQSPKLASILLPFIAKLTGLQRVSLRRTELKTFPPYPFVTSDSVQLDLSMNPLFCADDFQWILDQYKSRSNTSAPILLSSDITCCETPYRLEGVELRLVDEFGGLEKNSTPSVETTTVTEADTPGGYRLFRLFKNKK